jgi:uncharacterized membrane protein
MDYAAMPAMATAGKKQAKTKKAAKDVTVEERQAEYEKRASRREAAGLLFNPGRHAREMATGLDARFLGMVTLHNIAGDVSGRHRPQPHSQGRTIIVGGREEATTNRCR